ncbi:ATP-binding cassette domain-containing protein [Bacillus mexicanus]|uniref:cell division ATP-binding protein FtsE n=1 Tax=Bacillus mexicanus TaxID=2834415 RepID=UPI003D239296
MIEYRSVEKFYPNSRIHAIKDASFKIENGEFVFFMGKSGAGKTTLLKMLYKAEKPSEGTIMIFGGNIKKIKKTTLRRNIGVVFQTFELLENKTALENVSYVLECYGISPRKSKKKAIKTLDMMGLKGKEKQYPHEMSGGERQRVAIARAMINDPQILICDEPTGNLDDENAKNVMHYLKEINERGTTILMATHNKEIVREMKKRIIYVQDGYIIDKTYKNNVSLAEFISKREKSEIQ